MLLHKSFGTLLLGLAILPAAATAGPPFLTDDPEPTETGHWEIYGPFVDVEGRGGEFSGATGVELNYGAAKDLQITVGLPLAYSRSDLGWRWGAADLELSAKYRLYHDEAHGVQIAVFPGITLPTASNGVGAGRVTALLPVWAQKDIGSWSVFGGGGYSINPGEGNRNYWTGGLAVTRQFGDRVMLGAEVRRSGANTFDGAGSTSLGLGGIWQLEKPFRLLASGGPTFEDGVPGAGYHGYVALGLDF